MRLAANPEIRPEQGNILVVDDDEDVLLATRLLLKPRVEQIHTEPENISARLEATTYDVILLDMNFSQDATSGREGFTWLGRILEQDPSAVVVLITAFGGVETAVEAIDREQQTSCSNPGRTKSSWPRCRPRRG